MGLLALLVLGTAVRQHTAAAASDCTKVESQLLGNAVVQEFKACAAASPIPADCCIKLLPFVEYADCLQLPAYKTMANTILAPQVSVDRAVQECLG